MNLVPIDAGGTPPELIGGGNAPEGDFAALMTGLMSGDTQIVPLLDLPTGDQPADGTEPSEGEEPIDDTVTILEFVGTPPAGLVSPRITHAGPTVRAVGDADADPVDDLESPTIVPAADASIAPVPGAPIEATVDTGIGSATAAGLATVHPITNRTAAQATDDTATAADVPDGPSGPAQGSVARPVEARPVDGTAVLQDGSVDRSAPHATATAQPSETAVEPTVTSDFEPPQPDVELDNGTVTRPFETGRSGTTISQPAMVGIARRVEEAIAALANKPDPKVVTLQLDELDGMRLTVALRPDGIHLSSNGDAGLRAEIERALETRGFDMASNGDRSRQDTDQHPDDGWRPTSAGRPRRTNSSGIRF